MQTNSNQPAVQANPSWTGTVDSFETFSAMVDSLPDTIQNITVPSEVREFNPARTIVKPDTSSWREGIKSQIKEAISSGQGLEVDSFSIRCYYGKNTPDSSYYITLSSRKIRQFNLDMASGKYGSLD